MTKKKKIGYWSAVSIGVGGMVGGGIFAVLGLSVELARGGTPVAFAIAGMIALISSYSYARLSVAFPCKGGTVEFLNQAFGEGILTGGLNILLLISYVVMLSLYAYAFGSYGASFFPPASQTLWRHVLMSAVIIIFTGLNAIGAYMVGKAEEWIVGLKIIILLLFVGVGLWSVDPSRMQLQEWSGSGELIAGGMIIFLAYEGFELIANTAGDTRNPSSTLPAAYYSSVIFVIVLYVLVSCVTVGNLPVARIVAARDYALAESAKPFLGNGGFLLIAVAALLSTGSAINATLYGAMRISYIIAKEGELPEVFEKNVWRRPLEGLFITAGITLIVANLFDLSSISMMGSSGFLIIFATVNGANVVLYRKTGSRRWISFIGAVTCMCALVTLLWYAFRTSPDKLWVLMIMGGAAFGIEWVYRRITGRTIKPAMQ
jgi:amino acid transporter